MLQESVGIVIMSFPQCQRGGQIEQKNPARIVEKQGAKESGVALKLDGRKQ